MTEKTMPTCEKLSALLSFPALPPSLQERWEVAANCYSDNFLSDAALDDINRTCLFPEEIAQVLAETVAAVRHNQALRDYAWLWYAALFLAGDPPLQDYAAWPLPEDALGGHAVLFPAVIILAGFRHMLDLHRAAGISEDVTRATASDLAVWMRHYHRNNGKWGLAQLPWLTKHCRAKIFRLGRLQFEPVTYDGSLRAFKHRGTGEVVAVSEPGITYRRDGLIDGTNHVHDAQAWVSELEIGADVIRGHPIVPAGFARQEKIALPADLWEQKMAPGDPTMTVHVPEDGRMTHDLCGESFARVDDFFSRHCPRLPRFTAYATGSWMFDIQLQQLLPPTSNIVLFLREFYLSPLLSYQDETFFRIFGHMPADLTKAPRNTSLERAVLDFTLAGNALRSACGFILREDLQWGSQRYLRRYEDQGFAGAAS